MATNQEQRGFREEPRARNVQPKRHDTYKRTAKTKGALVCDECAVVNHGGKWYWGRPPLADVEGGLCPACERIRDNYPAGTIRLSAEFLPYKDEIRSIVAKADEAEKREHPLERLMAIEDTDEGLVVTTTGLHLARFITSRLRRRFKRNVEIRYPDEQNMMFVEWRSEEG